MRESSKRATGIILLALAGCTADAVETSNQAGLEARDEALEAPYVHPLQNGGFKDGVVLLDVKNDEKGRRFVVGDSASRDASGVLRRFTGVQTLERKTMTKAERGALSSPKRAVGTAPVIGETLQEALAKDELEEHVVEMHVAEHPDYEPIIYRMERAIARGVVDTVADRERIHKRFVAEQAAQIARQLDAATTLIDDAGGAVLSRCENSPCLLATLPRDGIEALAKAPLVARMDVVPPTDDNVIRGMEVSNGTQMTQFQDSNYQGDLSRHIRAGVIEWSGLNTSHLGYNDLSTGSSRMITMRNCSGGSCSSVTSYSSPADHPTGVTGLLAGDLTDGQDSAWTGINQRINRSGYAREASIRFWRADGGSQLSTALSDIISYDPDVLNMSVAYAGNTACNGETTASRSVNDVFEAGVPIFFAAGNNGAASATDCVVEAPGSAIGAFVVGAHGPNESVGTEDSVRNGAIATYSDRGGGAVEGKGRTIIDMTATGCRDLSFGSGGGYAYDPCGTSMASPTVAGGAVLLMDHYIDNYSSAIENPGSLTANLLLMGDRAKEGGGKMVRAFNNLWGAGRFKMRRFDDEGLDGPWGWGSYNTCIDNGETYTFVLGDGAKLPPSVDVLKVVMFYYDKRHEVGTTIDNLDLYLEEKVNGVWTQRRQSTSVSDEKERVVWKDFSGDNKWRIKIQGTNVTADDAGCGTNSMRAYFAFFYEDSARNDVDGPSADIDTE